MTEVLHTSVDVHPNFTCGTYGSCERVKTVTETSAMSNAEGFFAYQGQYEAIQHGAYIDFRYTKENPNAINPDTFSCCNFVDADKPQLGNQSCPCAYCQGMCSGDGSCVGGSGAGGGSGGGGNSGSTLGELDTPWYNGFVGSTSGGVWAAAVAVGGTVVWWHRRGDSKAREERRAARRKSGGSGGGGASGGAVAPRASGSRVAAGEGGGAGGAAGYYLALPSN
jgi:hypothetical protein